MGRVILKMEVTGLNPKKGGDSLVMLKYFNACEYW